MEYFIAFLMLNLIVFGVPDGHMQYTDIEEGVTVSVDIDTHEITIKNNKLQEDGK